MGEAVAICIQWVTARDTPKHPTMHRITYPLKELLAPNAKNAGVEKLGYNVL